MNQQQWQNQHSGHAADHAAQTSHQQPRVEPVFQFKEVKVTRFLPLLTQALDNIDSRHIFHQGVGRTLRLIAHLSLAGVVLIWLMSVVEATELSDDAPIFTVLLVQILWVLGSLYLWAICLRRADALVREQVSNVLQMFFRLMSLAVEMLAAVAVFWFSISGIATAFGGSDGAAAYSLATVGLPMKAMATDAVRGSSGGGEDSIEFGIRMMGLFGVIKALVMGFFALLAGYVLHDLLHLFYRFVERGGRTTNTTASR